MKSVLLVICILLAINVFSQDKYLSISKSGLASEVVFKENTRIRVKTIQGGKLSGKFHFVNESQVMIKNIIISITSISEIKKHPLLLNILVSGMLIIGGGFIIVLGIAVIAWGASFIGIGIGVAGAAITYGGIRSPNFLPKVLINNDTTVKMTNVLQ